MIKYETYLPNKCWNATSTLASQDFIRSNFDYGARQRRAISGYDTQSMTITVTLYYLKQFKLFWKDLNNGTDKFLTDQWINQDDTTDKIARYTAAYSVQEHDNDMYTITAPVELIQPGTS